jgi:hypothetical protein
MNRDRVVANYITYLGKDYPARAVGVHSNPPVDILPQWQNEYQCCEECPRYAAMYKATLCYH